MKNENTFLSNLGHRLVFTSPRRGMTDFATTNIFPQIRTIDLDAAQCLAVGEAVQVAIKCTQNAIASENLMHLPEIRRLAEANVKSLLSVQGMLECDSVVHGYEAAWPLPGMSEADAANAFESALKLLRLHGFAFVYCGGGELNERVQPSDDVLSNLEKATESIAPGQPESAYRLARAIETSLFDLSHVGETFWEAHAEKLKSSLANQGVEFLKTASLEQIEQHAGEEFAAMNANTKAGILAVVRAPGVAVTKAIPVAATTNQSWIDRAYPLQQISVQVQGTRHSKRQDIIAQLETVLTRLRAGDLKGQEHDDDFGYRFTVQPAGNGPSFFADPASSN